MNWSSHLHDRQKTWWTWIWLYCCKMFFYIYGTKTNYKPAKRYTQSTFDHQLVLKTKTKFKICLFLYSIQIRLTFVFDFRNAVLFCKIIKRMMQIKLNVYVYINNYSKRLCSMILSATKWETELSGAQLTKSNWIHQIIHMGQ